MRTTCRISGKKITPLFDLGNLYVTGFYNSVETGAPRGKLELGIGAESGLVQLCHSIERDLLYREYWYRSGTNSTMTKQLHEIANQLQNWVNLSDGDVVLDIGCNDGTLLKQYSSSPKLVKVGIDPALNLAEEGRVNCDAHSTEYFSKDAFSMLSGGKKAKVITAIAMLYDLEDPREFVQDVADSLTDDGIFVAQMSYTPLMIEQNAFDNIIHEHLEFYTLASIRYLFEQVGLKILDAQLNNVNAGSVRVIATKNRNRLRDVALFDKEIGEYRIQSYLWKEKNNDVENPETYIRFIRRVQEQKDRLMTLLYKLNSEGKTVFGYGASSKGNTLLQFYGINTDLVKAIVERQPKKHGLLTAGTWIPIVSEEEMRAARPDYLLILPWHFIHEFVNREKDFLQAGGKFIVPLPEVKII